jgi:uncharacterized protein (TIGR02996 family)
VTTEDDFSRALDATPDDWQTRLVFADWLEERGDERAEGYRALGRNRHVPWHDGGYPGFCHPRNTFYGRWSLPGDWYDVLSEKPEDGAVIVGQWWRQYRSRRESEDAAARAFAKLPPDRRAQLLAGITS